MNHKSLRVTLGKSFSCVTLAAVCVMVVGDSDFRKAEPFVPPPAAHVITTKGN
jgi:hypothetical protein